MAALACFFYVVGAWFFAELLSGLFHWWEDRYGDPAWPVLGKYVVAPNIEHHQRPRAFCRGNYLQRNWTTLVGALVPAYVFYLFDMPFLVLTCCFMSQANEIHSWAHSKVNPVIRFFQKLGIVQSHRQHAIHHRRPFDKYYCVMTDYLNPVLARLGFWVALEWLVLHCLRVAPRAERAEA